MVPSDSSSTGPSSSGNSNIERSAAEIEVVEDRGKGRPFVLLSEGPEYRPLEQELLTTLSAETRVVVMHTPRIEGANWSGLTESLLASIQRLSIKQASFIGLGAAGVLVQNLALSELRLVRTAVLIDSSTRAHPSKLQRLVDSIESRLPLGLPLRIRSQDFDGKPFLQRIRCPVLIVTTGRADAYLKAQARLLSEAMPTAWYVHLPEYSAAVGEAEALRKLVVEFQDVPARSPQKNLSRASGM